MQYELKYKVIEPKRHTYQNIIDRFGDQPASRYQEATLDIEPRENFHYRPTWDAERELYDERYSALRLTDPYTFADPRQYYYTPYVTNRAGFHDEFGKTLGYLESRDLLAKIPNVATSPAPEVDILQFNLVGPVLAVRPYTHTDHYWQVYFDTHKAIVETFGAAGYPVPETPMAYRQSAMQ